MDFGTVSAPSWEPKWSQNPYKIKFKQNEKMMMTWMAKKCRKSQICVVMTVRGPNQLCRSGGGFASLEPLVRISGMERRSVLCYYTPAAILRMARRITRVCWLGPYRGHLALLRVPGKIQIKKQRKHTKYKSFFRGKIIENLFISNA